MKESVLSLKDRNIWVFCLARKYLNLLWLTNNMFYYFGSWLIGLRIDFSCQYIPQGHYFISTISIALW